MRDTASIYLRLSSAATDENTGLASQEADLRALAERSGLRVVAVHVDDGLSGALRNRPGFLSWLDDGRSGRAGHLLAWKLDRVSRGSLQGLSRFLDVLDGVDAEGARASDPVRFLSHADALDSQAAGWDLQVAILGALAKGERENVRVRMLRHREANRASGRAVGGRRAWAFETAERPGGGLSLVPVPAHADAIRDALEILRGGGSLGDVVREWTARGLQPKSGERWHVSPLRRLLQNPNLYGATTHRGTLVRNEDGTVRVDEGQAILSLADWSELQALLEARSTSRSARSGAPALLSGLLSCGECGRTLYPHRPGGGRTWSYRCRGGSGCDRPTSVVMEGVEEFLIDVFRQTFGDRPVEEVVRRAPRVDAGEVARLQEALRHVEASLSGDLPDDEALRVLRQRRELRERLATIQEPQEVEVERVSSGLSYSEAFDRAASVEARREILSVAFDRITVLPGSQGGAPGDLADRISFSEERY